MATEITREITSPLIVPNAHVDMTSRPDDPVCYYSNRFTKFLERHYASEQNFNILKIPFHQIDVGRVTEEQIRAMRRSQLIESQAPNYVRKLLLRFLPDHELTSFILLWGGQENAHDQSQEKAVETIYKKQGRYDDLAEYQDELMRVRSRDWDGHIEDYTRAQIYAGLELQEHVTQIYYAGFSRDVNDPVLKSMMGEIGKVEASHKGYYHDAAQEEIKSNPHAQEEIEAMLIGDADVPPLEFPGRTFLDDPGETTDMLRAVSKPELAEVKAVIGTVRHLIGTKRTIQLATDPKYGGRVKQFVGNIDIDKVVKGLLLPW
jgi:hypothetical protein